MYSDTRWPYDTKRADTAGQTVHHTYTQTAIHYYLRSLTPIRDTLLLLLRIMTDLHSNQLANQRSWEVVRHTIRPTKRTVGAIVRHVDLHYFPRGGAPQDQGNVVNLPGGGQVLEKKRYFLVVGRMPGTLVECPIFTYGGEGLRGRNRDTWREYCSIRSLNVPVEGFMNQSPNNQVLDVEWEKGSFQVKQSAVVRLSELRFRDEDDDVDLVAAVSFGALQYAREKIADLISAAVMTAR